MYFKNRLEAGKMLADQIVPKYQNKRCTVVALSNGGIIIGAEIAVRLQCAITMLLTVPISLPRETDILGSVSETGDITYNGMYSAGELEELGGEFRSYIEQRRMESIHEINSLMGQGGLIRKDLLVDHTVILVSDGLNSGFSLDAAADYLKPIRIEKLIIATPIASVPAVDRMHIMADEIFCLDVLADYMKTDHYYEAKDVPDQDKAMAVIKNVVEHWREGKISPQAKQSPEPPAHK